MDVPLLGDPEPTTADGPLIRLLFCFQCKTLEELPDYEGHPEDDHLLAVLLERHQLLGIPHKGHLFKIPLKHWASDSSRNEIIKQIKVGSGGISELDEGFYDTKSTFQEDALKCFQAHLRPQHGCPDYGSSTKALIPQTHAERKDAGLPSPAKAAPKTFLCQFCPVHVQVMTKKRNKAGMYR